MKDEARKVVQRLSTLTTRVKQLGSKVSELRPAPAVSVVIPVHNAGEYLEETLRSALAQKVDGGLEVIAIDDGSTDGSWATMSKMRLRHRELRIRQQAASGGPGSPRNRGLDMARGEFVFFLDADDVLTPNSLGALVEAARQDGSDVVLGRLGSLGGRGVPQQMFRKTTHRADLLGDRAWDSLGPTKLMRRSLIEEHGLRFATDQWIGEDQPFVATCYLEARNVSILSDREYLLVRKREDGGNMTAREQKLRDKLKTAARLGSVVRERVEDADLRDRYTRRIFTATLKDAVGRIYANATPSERREFVYEASMSLPDLYRDYARGLLPHSLRLRYDLLMRGDEAGLTRAVGALHGRLARYQMLDGRARLALPDLGEAAAGVDLSLPKTGLATDRLLSLTVGDGLNGLSELKVPGCDLEEARYELVLRERSTGEEIILDTVTPAAPAVKGTVTLHVGIGQTAPLTKGAWGTFLRVWLGADFTEVRWGHHSAGLSGDPAVWYVGDAPVVAYFNRGYENLTLDVANTVHSEESVLALLASSGMQHGKEGL